MEENKASFSIAFEVIFGQWRKKSFRLVRIVNLVSRAYIPG